MDSRPIGVLDSGLGGLTALRELIRLMPGEEFIYFGDTGRVPYGTRSDETILKFARQDIRFLSGFGIKAAVVACGTISATALSALREEAPFPLTGVVEPAAEAAARRTRNGRIGLMATAASVRSHAYERALPFGELYAAACPLLVPLIENGRVRPEDSILRAVLSEYLAPLLARDVDTLILGCTHYPLIGDAITGLAPGVVLIDAGGETAARVTEELAAAGSLAQGGRCGSVRCYVSDAPDNFISAAEAFLGQSLSGAVSRIEIESF